MTSTTSSNATDTAISVPSVYVPFGVGEVTLVTSGALVLTDTMLWFESDPAVPGDASVRFARLLFSVYITPPAAAKASVPA